LKYVIIGGGPAGIFAAEAIRRRDRSPSIVIVTDEGKIARSPVMLTYWIGGEAPREGLWFRDPTWAEMNRVDLRLNRRAVALKTSSQKLILDNGEEMPYDPASHRHRVFSHLPAHSGAGLKGVHCLRQVSDAEAILTAISTLQQVIIIGGGFIGLKIATQLKERGSRH